MKIGIFDSGLGGLVVAQSLIKTLPQYDYLYLGDTARVPYGNRPQEEVYTFTRQAVDYLFANGCRLVIVACNTASAEALRKIQQDYLPQFYPDRTVLGVLIPAAEAAVSLTHNHRIGVLATTSTVASGAFIREIKKLAPGSQVFQVAAPLLVPLIEQSGSDWESPALSDYLAPLLKADIDCLILGCTHYPIIKEKIRSVVGKDVELISQDEIMPTKLADYLARHPEIATQLSHEKRRIFSVTLLDDKIMKQTEQLFGQSIHFELADLRQ